MVPQRLDDMLAGQCDLVIKPDVSRRSSDLHFKCSRRDVPLTHAVVGIISELLGMELHADRPCLARLKRNAGKALELDRTDVLSIGCRRQINLSHLVCRYASGILHIECKIYIFI